MSNSLGQGSDCDRFARRPRSIEVLQIESTQSRFHGVAQSNDNKLPIFPGFPAENNRNRSVLSFRTNGEWLGLSARGYAIQ